MRRILMLAAVLALALPAEASAADAVTYQVWHARGGKLWLTKRVQPATTSVAASATRALLAGPSVAELEAGVRSAIPDGTTLNTVRVASGVATVDVSGEFAAPTTTAQRRLRRAQLTFTLTQFPGIESVRLLVDGASPGAGVLTRDRFFDLLPPIVVWNPAIGSHLAGGTTVSGTAAVAGGLLRILLLNETGSVLAATGARASCAAPCRGGFSTQLAFSVLRDQVGTLLITGGDGQPQVRVPVVLHD
jgi:hypothetical protein